MHKPQIFKWLSFAEVLHVILKHPPSTNDHDMTGHDLEMTLNWIRWNDYFNYLKVLAQYRIGTKEMSRKKEICLIEKILIGSSKLHIPYNQQVSEMLSSHELKSRQVQMKPESDHFPSSIPTIYVVND